MLLIVVKPSGSHCVEQHCEWLRNEIVNRQLLSHWFYTSGRFDEDLLAIRQFLSKTTMVVVIGGDGTLNLVANVLANTGISMAVLPSGTGNDFVRQFRYSPHKWRALVFSDAICTIDLGLINERYFINIAGIGFNAAVVKGINTFKKRHKFSYLFAGLKHLFKFKHISENNAALMTIFANGQYFAAGLCVAPSGNVKSGQLVKLHFNASNLLGRIWSFFLMFVKQHESSKYVNIEIGDGFSISEENLFIEADGEVIGMTPARVLVCPAALNIKQ